MPNGPAVLLVGSFTQLYGTHTCLFAAQLQQHLVSGVVAVFGAALAKPPYGVCINRQGDFAGPLNQQTAAGGGLHLVVRVLLGDFQAEKFLPTGRLSAGAQQGKGGYQYTGAPWPMPHVAWPDWFEGKNITDWIGDRIFKLSSWVMCLAKGVIGQV